MLAIRGEGIACSENLAIEPEEKMVLYPRCLVVFIMVLVASSPLFSQQANNDGAVVSNETAEIIFERAKEEYSKRDFKKSAATFARAAAAASKTEDIELLAEIARELFATRESKDDRNFEQQAMQTHRVVLELAKKVAKKKLSGIDISKIVLDTGVAFEQMGLIRDALESFKMAEGLIEDDDARGKISERIKMVRRQLHLGEFEHGFHKTGQDKHQRRSKSLRTDERLMKLAADVAKYPAAAGQSLADFVVLTAVARSYISQVQQVERLDPVAEYLLNLNGFIAPAADVPQCNSLDRQAIGTLATEIERDLKPIVDQLDSVMMAWEADYLAVYSNSSLDTSQPVEGEPVAPSVALQRPRRSADAPIDDEELFDVEIEHLPLPEIVEASALYGDYGDASEKNLTRQVRQALQTASENRPRGRRTKEILEFDTRRMRVLAGALLQVSLLQRAREHAQSWESFQRRIDGLGLRQCLDRLEAEIPTLRISNTQEIIAEIRRIRTAYLGPLRDPMILSLQRWKRPDPDKADWARTSQILRWMALELRIKMSIYRLSWCQIKRQAELESELGIK